MLENTLPKGHYLPLPVRHGRRHGSGQVRASRPDGGGQPVSIPSCVPDVVPPHGPP
jgi:hypothetical protein